MDVVGWNNGSPDNITGAGYGIRISKDNRKKYFKEEWTNVIVDIEGEVTVSVNLTNSFWKKCSELRSSMIGKWMIESKLAPWIKGKPPKMKLYPLESNRFKLKY